ncbi:MAG: rRNA maturation RNase YbeY [Candidatus Taylorbacteria bacterium]|nr:rRNA maturation RNase YbeY [Candidatus Taylorbacteria bacterium]
MKASEFSKTKTIKRAPEYDGRVFGLMKKKIMPRNYELSLVFIGEKRSRTLNRTYRGKDKPTDILSFPLGPYEGEMFLNPRRSKIEAKKFGRSMENFLSFLFIHGLCHLKGMTHGSRMESEERKYRKMFNV